MATKIKFNIFKFLFRLFSFLADKTGGWVLFVKPKLLLGTLIMGLGVTACAPKEKKAENAKIKSTLVEMDTIVGAMADSVAAAMTPPIMTSYIICYFTEPVIKDDIITEEDTSTIANMENLPEFLKTKDEFIKYYDGNAIYDEEVEKSSDKTKTNVLLLDCRMPSFPGGDDELMKFLANNLIYPVSAVKDSIQGKILINFDVSTTGNIENVKVLKGIDPACDNEAVRVVKSMPKWIPSPEKITLTLPITFKIR